jgi:hypothetical protein
MQNALPDGTAHGEGIGFGKYPTVPILSVCTPASRLADLVGGFAVWEASPLASMAESAAAV